MQLFNAILLSIFSGTAALNNCGGKYYAWKTKQAMANPDPRLRVLVAHRGVWGPGCAEGSRCAINKAAEAGYEAIEIDIRADKTGMLWIAHDARVGRTTNWRLDQYFFNPWRDTEFGPKNPAYSEFFPYHLSMLQYRDINGAVTGEPLRNLESQLQFIKISHPHLLILFDVKSPLIVDSLVGIIKKLQMEHQSIIQFPISFFRPQQVLKNTGALSFLPVIYGDHLDGIALDPRNRGLGRSPGPRVLNYLKMYTSLPGFVAMEPPSKQFAKSRWGTIAVGPYAFVDNFFARMKGIGFGRFHAVAETKGGYMDANGHCCRTLQSMMSHSRLFGNQAWDDREKVNVLLETSSFVISDDSRGLMSAANNMGFRADICKIVGPA